MDCFECANLGRVIEVCDRLVEVGWSGVLLLIFFFLLLRFK